MSLLHHHPGHVPFDDDAGFPDPYGDRKALMEQVGKLRHRAHALEDELAHVKAERDHWKALAEKRRWFR